MFVLLRFPINKRLCVAATWGIGGVLGRGHCTGGVAGGEKVFSHRSQVAAVQVYAENDLFLVTGQYDC
jgi:hypothetical protein